MSAAANTPAARPRTVVPGPADASAGSGRAGAPRERLPGTAPLALSAGAASVALAAIAASALLADRLPAVAALAAVPLAACFRAPSSRRRLYLVGALTSGLGVAILSPLLWSSGGGALLWDGPTVPVLGVLDVSTDELVLAVRNGLRLAAVALAFAAYALLVDHDRLVASAGRARRSALAVALATRLVPTLERDAAGLAEAVRGRALPVEGVRGHALLLSPLVAGSLERATSLAEAMEARGFGRPGATRAPRPSWSPLDRAVAVGGALLVVVAAAWL